MNKNKLLIFFSIIFSLIIVEVITSLILPNKNDHNYKNRYMLFDEGKNFRNIKNFFTYHPNMSIASRNYYYEDGKFLKEYSYNIYTNNLGLVQKNDINKKEPSILFLGDSFTEGQGSKSWVDKFNGYYNKYHIINGGLLGTGFQSVLQHYYRLKNNSNLMSLHTFISTINYNLEYTYHTYKLYGDNGYIRNILMINNGVLSDIKICWFCNYITLMF